MASSETPESVKRDEDPRPQDELSMLDVFIVLAKRKGLVIGITLAAAIVAAGISMVLPSKYTGTTRILPPQQNASAAMSLLNQLGGGLGALSGAGAGLAGLRTNDIYVGILNSRTVADTVISRFKLAEVYGTSFASDTRLALAGRTSISARKDGILQIEVEDADPERSANLANGYVQALEDLTGSLAITESSQRRLFFERQLAKAREDLETAQLEAREALNRGGIAQVDVQSRALLEVTAQLRAQISAKEVQINTLRSYAANENPSLRMAQHELDALKSELRRIESPTPGEGTSVTKGAIPTGLTNLRQLRNLRYREMLHELLARQYEAAKMDEARDSVIVQVIDKAIVPDRRSSPVRSQIVALSTAAAFVLAVLLAFILEAIERTKARAEGAARLAALRAHLSGRATS